MERFVLGFVIGTAIGTVTVLALAPASGSAVRGGFTGRIRTALDAGRSATTAREQELWDDLRRRLKNGTEE